LAKSSAFLKQSITSFLGEWNQITEGHTKKKPAGRLHAASWAALL
jgi:hypothetical protein